MEDKPDHHAVEDKPDYRTVEDKPDYRTVEDKPDHHAVEDKPDYHAVEDKPDYRTVTSWGGGDSPEDYLYAPFLLCHSVAGPLHRDGAPFHSKVVSAIQRIYSAEFDNDIIDPESVLR